MDKLTITNAEWKTFNYEDYESGLFWLLVEAPEVDIDADDDGRTVGRYTGEVVRSAVLATVEQDHDGLPYLGLYAGIPEISVSPAPVPPRAHPGR